MQFIVAQDDLLLRGEAPVEDETLGHVACIGGREVADRRMRHALQAVNVGVTKRLLELMELAACVHHQALAVLIEQVGRLAHVGRPVVLAEIRWIERRINVVHHARSVNPIVARHFLEHRPQGLPIGVAYGLGRIGLVHHEQA